MKKKSKCFLLIFFLATNIVCASTEYDVRFLRGLAERNMFESVEFFCAKSFEKTDLLQTDKIALTTELVRSRTRQMLLAEPVQREKIRVGLKELELQILGPPDDYSDPNLSATRIEFEFQAAISEAALGDWLRMEAEVAAEADREILVQEVRKTLHESLERFKTCYEKIGALRQHLGSNAALPLELRTLALLRTVRFQWGLAQKSYALSFPPGDPVGDRSFGLQQAVEILRELASLRIDDGIVLQSRLELAACYRLLGELENGRVMLVDFEQTVQKSPNNPALTPELRFQAETELIRYRIAILETKNNVGPIDEFLRGREDSTIYPEYDLARIELLLALSRQKNTDKNAKESLLNDILKLVRWIEDSSGPYWGRRAQMLLSAAHNTGHTTGSGEDDLKDADSAFLAVLAEDRFRSGLYTEAVRLFERAGRVAEAAGNRQEAYKNAVAAAAVLEDVWHRIASLSAGESTSDNVEKIPIEEQTKIQLQLVELLRNAARRFTEHPEAAELHLRSVDMAGALLLEERFASEDYLTLLREHAELWPDSVKVPPLLLRAALLLEREQRFDAALAILERIPNSNAVAVETVAAAIRCFKGWNDIGGGEASGNSDGVPPAFPALYGGDNEIGNWFEKRLPKDDRAWNEADLTSALQSVEHFLRAFAQTKKADNQLPIKAEEILRSALLRYPNPSPTLKARIHALLVTALSEQGRKEEAAAILKIFGDEQIGSLSEEERQTFQRVQAKLFDESGQTQQAVNLLAKLLKQRPGDLELLEQLAEILSRQSDPAALAKAKQFWTAIADKSEKNTEPWWNARERILEITLKQGKIDEAKKDFELLRILYPKLGGDARKSRLEKQFTTAGTER